MTEKIRETLRDSKQARWTALALVSFTMMCGYFFADVMSPFFNSTTPGLERIMVFSSSSSA
jgi:hypothetical protein